jgi:hypothetical protein
LPNVNLSEQSPRAYFTHRAHTRRGLQWCACPCGLRLPRTDWAAFIRSINASSLLFDVFCGSSKQSSSNHFRLDFAEKCWHAFNDFIIF